MTIDLNMKRDWSVLIENTEGTGWLAIHSKASMRGGVELVMRTPHGPTIPLDLEDIAKAQLFFERVTRLVAEDAVMLRQQNSTLHAVRGVARQLIEAIDAGELDYVRATLESYALPKGQEL